MQPTLCSRCKKNVAVVFISKLDGEKTINEGLCLKCAKELGIQPVNEMMEKMGITISARAESPAENCSLKAGR